MDASNTQISTLERRIREAQARINLRLRKRAQRARPENQPGFRFDRKRQAA